MSRPLLQGPFLFLNLVLLRDNRFYTHHLDAGMQEANVRCFLGLGVEEAEVPPIQCCISPLQEEQWSADLRWVAPRNWHLTLAFLGNQPSAWLDRLRDGCQGFLQAASFEKALRLQGCRVGGFPDARGRIVALELPAHPKLLALKSGLDQVLRQQGFEPESRDFRPHITLARFERDEARPVAPLPCDIPLTFTRVTLFQSLPRDGKAEYSAIWSLPLSSVHSSN